MVKINIDVHGSLLGKQNLKMHEIHQMLGKILVVIKNVQSAIILAD